MTWAVWLAAALIVLLIAALVVRARTSRNRPGAHRLRRGNRRGIQLRSRRPRK